MEVSDELHFLATLPLEKLKMIVIGQEAGWGPEPVWKLWRREKNLLPLPGIEP
jgi:hypothetical protein